MVFGIINVLVGVITLGVQPWLITLIGTSTLIIADLTRISSKKLVFTNWKYDRNQNLFVAQSCKNCEPGKFNKGSWPVQLITTHTFTGHPLNIQYCTGTSQVEYVSYVVSFLALNQVWIRISFVSWPWLFTGDKGHCSFTWGWFLPTTYPR